MIRNESMEPLRFEVGLELGSDFADIFAVKEHDFTLGDPENAKPLPPPAPAEWNGDGSVSFADGDDRTQVLFSLPGRANDSHVVWEVELASRERWELVVEVLLGARRERPQRPAELRRRAGARPGLARRLAPARAAGERELGHARAGVPALGERPRRAAHARRRRHRQAAGGRHAVVHDRLRPRHDHHVPADAPLRAGACADRAARARRPPGALPTIRRSTPSPGRSSTRCARGKAAVNWFARYYGTVDATPLYLVLLSEVWRWTDDTALANELKGPALAALAWIDEWGDRDGDGFVEFERRAPHGLEVQSWKDSGDSQRFHDGTIAKGPIAPCEVQGYVYAAKVGLAEVARVAWRDRALADRLEREAAELAARFDEAFWVEERGGFYALALDGEKRRVDSLTSNIGHLLFTGIVPPERVGAVVDQLMSPPLWSGWGVRTMSSDDAGFNPLSYHNGTVWPHDNSLIAWGLARQGYWQECHQIVRRMLDAAGHFDWQLPEVFAGLERAETPFPIAYPTAARPQAWAAGTPVLLLQLLLGLVPDRDRHRLTTVAPELPSWAGELRVSGIPAFDRRWDAVVEDGSVRVEAAR